MSVQNDEDDDGEAEEPRGPGLPSTSGHANGGAPISNGEDSTQSPHGLHSVMACTGSLRHSWGGSSIKPEEGLGRLWGSGNLTSDAQAHAGGGGGLLSKKRGPRHWVLPLLAILINRRPKPYSSLIYLWGCPLYIWSSHLLQMQVEAFLVRSWSPGRGYPLC